MAEESADYGQLHASQGVGADRDPGQQLPQHSGLLQEPLEQLASQFGRKQDDSKLQYQMGDDLCDIGFLQRTLLS